MGEITSTLNNSWDRSFCKDLHTILMTIPYFLGTPWLYLVMTGATTQTRTSWMITIFVLSLIISISVPVMAQDTHTIHMDVADVAINVDTNPPTIPRCSLGPPTSFVNTLVHSVYHFWTNTDLYVFLLMPCQSPVGVADLRGCAWLHRPTLPMNFSIPSIQWLRTIQSAMVDNSW